MYCATWKWVRHPLYILAIKTSAWHFSFELKVTTGPLCTWVCKISIWSLAYDKLQTILPLCIRPHNTLYYIRYYMLWILYQILYAGVVRENKTIFAALYLAATQYLIFLYYMLVWRVKAVWRILTWLTVAACTTSEDQSVEQLLRLCDILTDVGIVVQSVHLCVLRLGVGYPWLGYHHRYCTYHYHLPVSLSTCTGISAAGLMPVALPTPFCSQNGVFTNRKLTDATSFSGYHAHCWQRFKESTIVSPSGIPQVQALMAGC